MTDILPSGPLPNTETLRRLKLQGKLSNRWGLPIRIEKPTPVSQADEIRAMGSFYTGLSDE